MASGAASAGSRASPRRGIGERLGEGSGIAGDENAAPYPAGMKTKAEWAAARAAQARQQAAELELPDPANRGDWRAVQQRRASARHLRAESARFDRIAAALRRSAT